MLAALMAALPATLAVTAALVVWPAHDRVPPPTSSSSANAPQVLATAAMTGASNAAREPAQRTAQERAAPSPFFNSGGHFDSGARLAPRELVLLLGDEGLLRAAGLHGEAPHGRAEAAGGQSDRVAGTRKPARDPYPSAAGDARHARVTGLAGTSHSALPPAAEASTPAAPSAHPLPGASAAPGFLPGPGAPPAADTGSPSVIAVPVASAAAPPPRPPVAASPPVTAGDAPAVPGTAAPVVVLDGRLEGFGPIPGLVVVGPGGTLAPGASPGHMVVEDFELDGGVLDIDVFGPVAGIGHDLLAVDGIARFTRGTIRFDFSDEAGNVYLPELGATFEFLVARGGIVGFDGNDALSLIGVDLDDALDFVVSSNDTSLTLEIIAAGLSSLNATAPQPDGARAASAPGSVPLVLAGLVSMGLARRRQRAR